MKRYEPDAKKKLLNEKSSARSIFRKSKTKEIMMERKIEIVKQGDLSRSKEMPGRQGTAKLIENSRSVKKLSNIERKLIEKH